MTGEIVGIFSGIALIIFTVCFWIWIIESSRPSKSFTYRKYLTDMYVSATIRSEAKKNGLTLEQEEKNFLVAYKAARKLSLQDLDDRIEESLSDKIAETIDTKDSKK